MKIAITGASGHIGGVLIPELLRKDHDVSVLTHEHANRFSHVKLREVVGSINDVVAVTELLTGCDAVIHAAALISVSKKNPDKIHHVNVDGSRVMLEAALKARVKKFIQVSSIHAFQQAPSDKPLDEYKSLVSEGAPAYDRSKKNAQVLALSFVGKGLDVTVLNPTSIVGPPDYRPSLMGQAIIGMCNGTIPAILNGGFDFVDVRDVAGGIINAMHQGRKGACYLLSGKWYSIKDITSMLSRISGRKISLPIIPVMIARAGVPFTGLFARLTGKQPLYTNESIDALINGNRFIDSSKAQAEIDYAARPFEETLHDIYNWFLKNGYIKN